MSPPSRPSTIVRDEASGHWPTIAWRWERVMVQITSAWRTSWRGQRLRFVVGQLQPLAAHHAHGLGTGPSAHHRRNAGRHDHHAVVAQLAGSQPRRSAIILRHSTSAIGLRQVLPVQTNRMIRLDRRRSVCSGNDARPQDLEILAAHLDHRRRLAQPAAAVVEHQLHLVAQRRRAPLRPSRGRRRPGGWRWTARRARPASARCRAPSDGPGRESRSCRSGATARCTDGGS